MFSLAQRRLPERVLTRSIPYLMMQPSPTRQYLPREITTACPGPVLRRSPRMMAPFAMIVFPPRMMFCGPAMVARRETLLPVSCQTRVSVKSISMVGKLHKYRLSRCIPTSGSRWGGPWRDGGSGKQEWASRVCSARCWRQRNLCSCFLPFPPPSLLLSHSAQTCPARLSGARSMITMLMESVSGGEHRPHCRGESEGTCEQPVRRPEHSCSERSACPPRSSSSCALP